MANAQEIKQLIDWLVATYPGKFQNVTAGSFSTADGYMEDLADVPWEAVKAAARQYRSEGHEWPPNSGQLRQRCVGLLKPALPAWADAWSEVLDQIQRVGWYGTPRFSHPLIAQACNGLGDWQTVCTMERSETATWRAQFRDIYNAYAGRAEREASLIPDARALALKSGAIAAPVEPDIPALPAPTEETAPAGEYIDFPAKLREWRLKGMQERSEQGRKIAEEAVNG